MYAEVVMGTRTYWIAPHGWNSLRQRPSAPKLAQSFGNKFPHSCSLGFASFSHASCKQEDVPSLSFSTRSAPRSAQARSLQSKLPCHASCKQESRHSCLHLAPHSHCHAGCLRNRTCHADCKQSSRHSYQYSLMGASRPHTPRLDDRLLSRSHKYTIRRHCCQGFASFTSLRPSVTTLLWYDPCYSSRLLF